MSDSNPILFSSAQSIEAYQQAIEQSTQAVMQWLKQPEMYQGKTVAELRDRIKLDFNPKGLGNEAAIERAVEFFLKDSLSVHHPQCVAHLHCPSRVVSQAAEVLINATNQSMDSWDQSPSATIIEIKLIEWLRTRVGYQAGDAGVFTSGGTRDSVATGWPLAFMARPMNLSTSLAGMSVDTIWEEAFAIFSKFVSTVCGLSWWSIAFITHFCRAIRE